MAYEKEIQKLERRFEENPDQYFAPLADAHRKAGDYDRALQLVTDGLERRPDYISGRIVRGRCLVDLGDNSAASEVFESVLELDPENIIAFNQLATLAEDAGDKTKAVGWLEKLLEVDPLNDEAQEWIERLKQPEAEGEPGAKEGQAEGADLVEAAVVDPEAPPEGLEAVEPVAPPGASEEEPDDRLETELQPEGPVLEQPESDDAALVTQEPDQTVELEAPAAGVEDQAAVPIDLDAEVEKAEEVVLSVESTADTEVEDQAAVPTELGAEVEKEEEVTLSVESTADTEVEDQAAVPTELGAEVEKAEEVTLSVDPTAETEKFPAIDPEEPVGEPPEAVVADVPVPAAAEMSPVSEDETPGATQDLPLIEPDLDDVPAGEAEYQAEPVITETMAEVYVSQGLVEDAKEVYRQLIDQYPGDEKLMQKLAALEASDPEVDGEPVPQSAGVKYSATETGGISIRAKLQQVAASPIPVAASPPPSVDPVTSSEPSPSSEPPPEQAGEAGDMSFDTFFGPGEGTQGEQPPTQSESEEDAAKEEFGDWLKGLKS